MIEHEDSSFDDSVLRPYSLALHCASNFKNNECDIFTVSGMPEGIGKSGYVHHTLADVCGYYKCKERDKLQWMWRSVQERPKDAVIWESDWETPKHLIKYHPIDVVKLCMEMLEKGKREPAFHWDDAGTWLNSMDFRAPFVISFMKYLSLARTNWGAIILSAPVEDWVLKKLHTAEGVCHIKILKANNDAMIFKPRLARAYKLVRYPGRVRFYCNTLFQDYYMAIMPDSFYKWYKPQRDHYARIAVDLMKKSLEHHLKEGWMGTSERDMEIIADMEKHIDRANDKSLDFNELVDQVQGEHSS